MNLYGTMPPTLSGNGTGNGTGTGSGKEEDNNGDDNGSDDVHQLQLQLQKHQISNNNMGKMKILSIDEAIERVGNGPFQHRILVAAGLCFMADAMEVLLLSFLSTVLKHEWDLSESSVDSIVAVVFAGALLGTLVLGTAGDLCGRKPVFLVTAALIALAGIATAFCQTYFHLLVARFWVGFGVGGLTVPFDTLGEFLPTEARGKNLLYIEFFWTVGTMSVPALAYWTLDTDNGDSHWQLFVILCTIPCFLSAILGLVLVPESPRWLLEQSNRCHSSPSPSHSRRDNERDNHHQQALDILRFAARTNGISQTKIDRELFPPNTLLVLSINDDNINNIGENGHHNDNGGHAKSATIATTMTSAGNHPGNCSRLRNIIAGFRELFRTPDRTRMISFLLATWFGFGFLYYGVIIAVSMVFTNEGTSGDGDGHDASSYDFDFAGIFITSSAEIFGLIAVIGTIDSIGRVRSQSNAYRIGGVSTFGLGILCALWAAGGAEDNNNNDDEYDNNNTDTHPHHRWILIGLAFVARMAMMGASCTTWVATTEMLATDIRSTGHGTANAMARLGGFFAPYVITEGNSMVLIGTMVLLVSLVTAECASRLPETSGMKLGEVTTAVVDDAAAAVSSKTAEKASPNKSSHSAAGGITSSSYHELL